MSNESNNNKDCKAWRLCHRSPASITDSVCRARLAWNTFLSLEEWRLALEATADARAGSGVWITNKEARGLFGALSEARAKAALAHDHLRGARRLAEWAEGRGSLTPLEISQAMQMSQTLESYVDIEAELLVMLRIAAEVMLEVSAADASTAAAAAAGGTDSGHSL